MPGRHSPKVARQPIKLRKWPVGVIALLAMLVGLPAAYASTNWGDPQLLAAPVGSVTCALTSTQQICPRVQVTVVRTVPGPTTTVTITPAGPGSIPPSSPPTTPSISPTITTTMPPTGGFPDAASTGPTGQLVARAGSVTVPAATVLSGMDIAGSVTLGAGASLTNSKVRCAGERDFCVSMGRGSTLSGVEVGGGADGTTYTSAIGIYTGGPGNTITRTDVHHVSDGLRVDGGTTLVDSWIHDLVTDQLSGVHSDGAQVTAGSAPIVLVHDSIEGGTNDAFFDETSTSPLSIDQCLFTANTDRGNQSSYGVAVYPQLSSVSVTNSTFSRGWQVGPLLLTSGTSSGNTYTDGTPI